MLDGALQLLAHKEEHGGPAYASAREVWASLTTTRDIEYLGVYEIETILREGGFTSLLLNEEVKFTLGSS